MRYPVPPVLDTEPDDVDTLDLDARTAARIIEEREEVEWWLS